MGLSPGDRSMRTPDGRLAASAALALSIVLSLILAPPSHAQSRKTMPSSFQIVETSIDDIHAAMRAGKLTAQQLVQAYLDRITAYDKGGPNINSIITLNPHALDEARELDAVF